MKCFIFDSFYRNCRILKHLLFRIFSMSLHTYSEHKSCCSVVSIASIMCWINMSSFAQPFSVN